MSDAGKGHGAAWCCGICVCVNMCALGNYSCNLLEAEIWTQAARKSNVCSYIYISLAETIWSFFGLDPNPQTLSCCRLNA